MTHAFKYLLAAILALATSLVSVYFANWITIPAILCFFAALYSFSKVIDVYKMSLAEPTISRISAKLRNYGWLGIFLAIAIGAIVTNFTYDINILALTVPWVVLIISLQLFWKSADRTALIFTDAAKHKTFTYAGIAVLGLFLTGLVLGILADPAYYLSGEFFNSLDFVMPLFYAGLMGGSMLLPPLGVGFVLRFTGKQAKSPYWKNLFYIFSDLLIIGSSVFIGILLGFVFAGPFVFMF